jgi:hypothetical protein
MIITYQPKWIDLIYRCGGGHISLKVGKDMNIGGVLAPVIHAMVCIDFT